MRKPERPLGRAALIRPAPCPAVGGTPFIPIALVSTQAISRFLCLSEEVTGYLLHFVEGPGKARTLPHTPSGTFCEGCRQGRSIRWKGFVCGLMVPTYKRFIVEVTAGAYRNCPALMELKGQLRGKTLELARMHAGSRNAPLRVEVKEYPFRGKELPQAWDLHSCLLRLWGFHTMPTNHDSGLVEDSLDQVPENG